MVPVAAVSEPGYMFDIALVTARPIVAQTMPAIGPVMSWLAVTPYRVFVNLVRGQQDSGCNRLGIRPTWSNRPV